MFDDAWRTMKYRFYDPKMHGLDWDAARAKYQPLVAYVGDRQELMNVINEMIGELNASHTGAAPAPQGRDGAVSTGHLGLDLEPDEQAGRYKVTHVYEDGPADKDWIKVGVGDYLLAIDGKPVKAGDNYWQLLNSNNRLNRKVEVTLNSKPTDEGAWRTRIEPISSQAYSQLRYERWVKERREAVDKLSDGRVGYLHIQAMDQPSLAQVREGAPREPPQGGAGHRPAVERRRQHRAGAAGDPRPAPVPGLAAARHRADRPALRRLLRPEGGAAELALGLQRRDVPRRLPGPGPGQDHRHADDGRGHRHRQLLPDRRLDGPHARRRRLPGRPKRTNMENYGVQPDILVENTPEDNLAGRDRQLETATQELLKQIGQKGTVVKKE